MKITKDIKDIPGIYMILAKDHSKGYVGSTKDLRRRGLTHNRQLREGKHYNKQLQQLYDNYKGDLKFEATPALDVEEAMRLEQLILDVNVDTPWLCNINTNANQCGKPYVPNPETVERIRQLRIGQTVSQEHRDAISETLTGRKLSPEHAAKTKVAALGRINKPEHNHKISEANKGRVFSEETKAKMSESAKVKVFTEGHRRNIGLASLGRKRSPESIEKSRIGIMKPVEVNGIQYRSIGEASEANNMTVKMMFDRLNSDKHPEFVRLNK